MRHSGHHISLIAAFAALTLIYAPPAAAQSTTNDAISDAENAGRQSVEAVFAKAEEQTWLREQRLALCRRSTRDTDDYPNNILQEQARHPELGSRLELLELCQAYLHGYQDASIRAQDVLKRLAR